MRASMRDLTLSVEDIHEIVQDEFSSIGLRPTKTDDWLYLVARCLLEGNQDKAKRIVGQLEQLDESEGWEELGAEAEDNAEQERHAGAMLKSCVDLSNQVSGQWWNNEKAAAADCLFVGCNVLFARLWHKKMGSLTCCSWLLLCFNWLLAGINRAPNKLHSMFV
jgi:hypothetical protein